MIHIQRRAPTPRGAPNMYNPETPLPASGAGSADGGREGADTPESEMGPLPQGGSNVQHGLNGAETDNGENTTTRRVEVQHTQAFDTAPETHQQPETIHALFWDEPVGTDATRLEEEAHRLDNEEFPPLEHAFWAIADTCIEDFKARALVREEDDHQEAFLDIINAQLQHQLLRIRHGEDSLPVDDLHIRD